MGTALILVASAAIGITLGLTALGGFLLVPVLAALGPMPLAEAIAISLFTSIPSALFMLTQFRRQGVPVGVGAGSTIAASALGGFAGGLAMPALAPGTLALLLALVVLTASTLALVDVGARLSARRAAGAPGDGRAEGAPSAATRAIVAVASASIASMTGAGGPVISIPLLLSIGTPVRDAIIASLWMMLAGTSTATALNLVHGTVRLPLALACTAVILAGNVIGMRLARGLDTTTYRRLVATTGVLTGVWLLVRASAPG